jgi:choline kinase
MLDSRAPPGEKYSYQEQEAQVERDSEEETKRLMAETSLWRLANSAQWVAWGIVQAHVPGMPQSEAKAGMNEQARELEGATAEMRAEAENEEDEPGEEQEEEFDYLAYAQERAMFAWGDAIRLGIVKAEELPGDMQKAVKHVEY